MINQNNYHVFLIALIPYIIICITLAIIGRSRGQSFVLVLFVSFFTGWIFGIFLVLAAKGKRAAASIIGILLCALLIGCGEDNPVGGNHNNPLDTDFVPLTPYLKSPLDGDTAISLMPIFTWSNKGDSLQVSENGSFDNPFCFTVSDSSYNLPIQLNSHKWYYWRIGAKGRTNHVTIIYWSQDIYHFRTTF